MKFNKDVDKLAEAYQLIMEAGGINPYSSIQLKDDIPFKKGNPDADPSSEYDRIIDEIKEASKGLDSKIEVFVNTPQEDQRRNINATGDLKRTLNLMLILIDKISDIKSSRRIG